MALNVTAVETSNEYVFTVTDGVYKFVYRFGKDQDIQVSKREAELLAQMEINKNQPPQEIIL